MAHTREEIIAAVKVAFPLSDLETILAILDFYGTEPHEREIERVKLAIITLSEGSEDKLLYLVQAAKIDYRDILYWITLKPRSMAKDEQQRLSEFQLKSDKS